MTKNDSLSGHHLPINVAQTFAEIEAKKSRGHARHFYANVIDSFNSQEAARKEGSALELLGHTRATLYVTLSTIILSFAALFKVIPILIFYVMWLSVIFLKGTRVIRLSRDMVWAMSVPLICLASSLWSDDFQHTLYLGAEYALMVFCVVIMSRSVDFYAFANGICIGIFITLIITLSSGIYGADYMTKTYSLVGYFGSKNAVGGTAEIGLAASVVLFFTTRNLMHKLVFYTAPILLSAYCLHLSKSGTAVLSMLLAFSIAGFMLLTLRVPKQLRSFFIALLVLLGLSCAGVMTLAGGYDVVLKMLGKDSTLTGRTYLWHEGIKAGLEKPLLGHGYNAFWIEGNALAKRYWYEFEITAKSGFHFHNTFIQSFVDIGAVGLAFVVLVLFLSVYTSLKMLFAQKMLPEATLLLLFACMFGVRAFAEVDTLGPFGIGVFIYYSLIPRLAAMRDATRAC